MGPKVDKKKIVKERVAHVLSTVQLAEGSEYDDVESKEFGADELLYTEEPLKLSEEELDKDVTLILTDESPYFSDEFVEYSFKDFKYKTVSTFAHPITAFKQIGSLAHKNLYESGIKKEASIAKESGDIVISEELDTKRKNKFNFCDRGVQTSNCVPRDAEILAEPPPQTRIEVNCTLLDMVKAFKIDAEKASPQKTSEKLKWHPRRNQDKDKYVSLPTMGKILDRMVNQNRYSDVVTDFMFYDNPYDEFSEGKGSLLSLWSFAYRSEKKLPVTEISWNQYYGDLFAISFGTNTFLNGGQGCICIFSFKCPSCPEKIYRFDVSVQSIQFHHMWNHMLVAGFSDGNVAIFDVRHASEEPIATSDNCGIQHYDAITQVRWLDDNVDEQLNFCSIAADGKIINWSLAHFELLPFEIFALKDEENPVEGPEGVPLHAISNGTSVSFRENNMDVFLAATEEGLVHKCSYLYGKKYLSTYKSHGTVVYKVEWNPYHPHVFLCCSADWNVLIWEDDSEIPTFIFTVHDEIRGASWAPYSSTLFGATTKGGMLYIYDLTISRLEAICSYVVYEPKKQAELTCVAFNPKHPVIAVGDNKGCVRTFKMSPNLRSSLKDYHEMEREKFVAGEKEKLDKVLKLVKSPEAKEIE